MMRVKKEESLVPLLPLLTWLLSFPKNEAIVNAPHLQLPGYSDGRHWSSCSYTAGVRICI